MPFALPPRCPLTQKSWCRPYVQRRLEPHKWKSGITKEYEWPRSYPYSLVLPQLAEPTDSDILAGTGQCKSFYEIVYATSRTGCYVRLCSVAK